ncbi:MAG: hypothetical protein K6T51_01400 [Rubrobacteraceae bacterium]|nr:hypothetical protein [Rubrobacteraceae bacterium]
MSCPICYGSDTCPEGLYVDIRPADESDIRYVRRSEIPDFYSPQGWKRTHSTSREVTLLREVDDNGLELELVGRNQADRIEAHYGVEPRSLESLSYSVRSTGSARIARLWWEGIAGLSMTEWGRLRLAELAGGES